MQIPCFFKPGPYEAAYIVAALQVKTPLIDQTVESLVDTGASRTNILGKDATRIGLDYRRLEKHTENILGIGGTVETYTITDAKLTFRTKNGKNHTETLQKL